MSIHSSLVYIFFHSSVHSVNISNVHIVPGTVLGAKDTVVNEISKAIALMELTV